MFSLKIDSVDQKSNELECGNFSQDAGTPGTERVIAFSQLAVKGLTTILPMYASYKHCLTQTAALRKIQTAVGATRHVHHETYGQQLVLALGSRQGTSLSLPAALHCFHLHKNTRTVLEEKDIQCHAHKKANQNYIMETNSHHV
jgi:hypothetical protein